MANWLVRHVRCSVAASGIGKLFTAICKKHLLWVEAAFLLHRGFKRPSVLFFRFLVRFQYIFLFLFLNLTSTEGGLELQVGHSVGSW